MNTIISLKNINKLAIPALISGVSEPILSLTDAAIVGNIELNATESLAAVGIVSTFLSMLIWVLGQTRSAISSIVSQYLGAGNVEAVKNLPAQAIFIITSLSLLIIAFTYPFASQIFKLYNASNIILEYSVDYYKIRVFGFPFTLFTIAVFGTFRGLQNTYYPMLIAISGAIANIIFDFILVYGIADVIPPLHIKGAAYASVIAQMLMAGLSAFYILKKTDIPLLVKFPFNPEIKRFTLMILNLFIRTIALNVALYFATSFATSYGPTYIAAYTIAINLWFLGAFLIDGYASAGNILSGKLLGAKDYKNLILLSNKLIKYGILIGLIIAVIGGAFYYFIGSIFSNNTEVLNAFYDVFWIVLIMQPLCALAFIFDGVFKGLGKMKYLRNLLLFSTLLVFIPVILYTDSINLKLHGIFIAFTFWIIARGFPLIIKLRKTFRPLAQNP
ncbi:MATE family efflux transporter [Winogradskyella sp. PC-19]|uniref:MATE family efflux transporter n=1 Tax=unclassified Winogradskyella TaxID=2615021 RepID=UPI000B3D3E48|nr:MULTISPECIES: MATE family efflux transporter [unclassified Winogradskyella]ARV09792.1 MATE family efflux transporter [Winogradskyella sp. PC-19]RZN82736.1 MAG: MATE family efflux transporter [Winogradskyella sp.]